MPCIAGAANGSGLDCLLLYQLRDVAKVMALFSAHFCGSSLKTKQTASSQKSQRNSIENYDAYVNLRIGARG